MDAIREMLAERVVELEDERDALLAKYHLLASEMVYEGSSVQHWRAKALAYKECAMAVYRLKQLTGKDSTDDAVEAAQAMAAHVERLIGAGCDMQDDYQMGDDSPHHSGIDAWAEALKDTPTTSLAHLKAQWQAEWIKSVELQARRVRNFSDPDDVFEAVPLTIICQAEEPAPNGSD